MILLGRNLSPFVRRSATVLQLLNVEHEQRILNTADDIDFIRQHNPLGRVPALVLADDETLVDSAAIIDHVLEIADQDHALLPASGAERRRTLYLSALATGAMEKGVASAYEKTQRPAELYSEAIRDRLRGQAFAGLATLDDALGDADWFGGATPNLADVNAVVAFDFLGIVAPDAPELGRFTSLQSLTHRSAKLAAFANTRWTA